jgi:hypothetical protein
LLERDFAFNHLRKAAAGIVHYRDIALAILASHSIRSASVALFFGRLFEAAERFADLAAGEFGFLVLRCLDCGRFRLFVYLLFESSIHIRLLRALSFLNGQNSLALKKATR